MCRRVECSTCGRPTFAGCGAHVEQVLRDVSPPDRCHCREKRAAGAESAFRGAYEASEAAARGRGPRQ